MKRKITLTFLLILSISLYLSAQNGRVVISEVFYDSPLDERIDQGGHHTGEFIELFNSSDIAINISGWQLKEVYGDNFFTFPYGTVIAPKDFILITYKNPNDNSLLKINKVFPQLNLTDKRILYQQHIILFNYGEIIQLINNSGAVVDYFAYGNENYNNLVWNLTATNGRFDNITSSTTLYSLQRFGIESYKDGIGLQPTHLRKAKTTPLAFPNDIAFLQSEFFNYHLSKDQNFVYKAVPQTPIKDFSLLVYNQVSRSDIIENVIYYDGLGRPIQEIRINQSPARNDIITIIEYDPIGREAIKNLPYSIEGSGEFKNDPFKINLTNFYKTQTDIAHTNFPFTETIFDDSPLNRVMEQGAQGESWQVVKDINNKSTKIGHTVKYNYLINTSSDGVIIWTIENNGNCIKQGTYAAGKLIKNEIIDENGNVSIEFKDLNDKLILIKVFDGNNYLLTYYTYDDFGRLRYVFPPKAVDEIGAAATITPTSFDELIYYYKYDSKGRMIEKKIPGAKSVYMVYNNRDQLVMSQDGNLRLHSKWNFIKYDNLNRAVMTGVVQLPISINQDQLINAFTSHSVLYESFNTGLIHGYTLNNSFPSIAAITSNDILTATYYDNYTFKNISGFQALSFDNSNKVDTYVDNDDIINGYFNRVTGLVTGAKVRVLDNSATPNWIYTVNYYDDLTRVIQTVATNYAGGTDNLSTQYNFTGLVLVTRHAQSVNFGSVASTVEYTYNSYDHAGRLLKTEHQIGTNTDNRTILASLEYNENGQVIEKNLAGNSTGQYQQSVDYTYNIRGWVNGINDPDSPQTTDPGDDFADLFDMKFYFNNPLTELGQTTSEINHNGNIAGVKWAHKDDAINAYAYKYDKLNRLLSANYGKNTSGWNNNEFDVLGRNNDAAGIAYDKNGNIRSLGRKDENAAWKHNLDYRYNGNKLMALGEDGLVVSPTVNDYIYDDNGNMTNDAIKGLMVNYNILNLPQKVDYSSGNYINYIYTATGQKLAQDIYVNNTLRTTTDYVGNIIYKDGLFQYLLTPEGKVNKPNTNYVYEYHLKDHLGNVRVAFEPGSTGPIVTQKSDYYPFGLRFAGMQNNENKYQYNGKEWQEGINTDADAEIELPLDWLDYGFRMYDATLGRFVCIDPKSDKFAYVSPFNYAENRPIDGIDLWGLQWVSVIDKNGINNINVNVNFVSSFDVNILPEGTTILDYQNAINDYFNQVLQTSNSNFRGSVTFDGGNSEELGQVVPTLTLTNTFLDNTFGGWTTFEKSDVNIYNSDGSFKNPIQMAQSSVHELLHTLRISDIFDKVTQSPELNLLQGKRNEYFTTESTDPNIFYNTMCYGTGSINGILLNDLWQIQMPYYLTSGQLDIMLNEIFLQQQGFGLGLGDDYYNYWLNIPVNY